jgi:photosystem II stability/assembly factor-like uncharacterized protein
MSDLPNAPTHPRTLITEALDMRQLSFSLLRVPCVALLVLISSALAAQTKTGTTQPQFKGILEPVSYTEDLDLTDVFFVNGEVGWVAGKSGTILRTIDAGKTWEAQLGGDPEDKSPPVRELHFLDERRGWAVQGEAGVTWKMLHTRDGESWEEIGTVPYGARSIVFTSPLTGYLAGNPSMSVTGGGIMFRTTDGGRTWKPVFTCQAKVSMGGLNQNIDCVFGQIRFPTPNVGYAVANRGCTACGAPPLIAKTSDGGETWSIMIGPGVLEEDEVSSIAFLDEQTGFARLASKKLHVTTDGGATWRGIVASPGEAIQFADPSVGWAVALDYTELRLSYTTDGGKRWTSREVKLPTTTRAFSLPRRDRAYIVGANGMIFRYSVVPAAQALGPNDKALPAMPGFDSPLDEQVTQLEKVIEQVGSELTAAPDTVAGASAGGAGADPAATAAADSAAAASEPLDAPLPAASPYTSNCCKKSFSRLEVILGAMSQSLPEFIGKYKNLNLLLAAIRMGAELPGEYRAVKGGLRAFRKAQDKETAQAALSGVSAALSAFKATTAISMQQQLPPPPSGDMEAPAAAPNAAPVASPQAAAPTSSPPPNAAPSAASSSGSAAKSVAADAATATKDAVKDSTKAVGKDAAKETADKAKKALGGFLRKKKP